MQSNILHLFQNQELEKFCREVLNDYNFQEFDIDGFSQADIVLTDSGVTVGKIPGFVPALLMIGDDEQYPDSFYTRLIDKDLTETDLVEEIEHSKNQAEIGRQLELDKAKVLNADILNELVSMGGERVVKEGLRNLIKNTTLELNECRASLERKNYDEIRFAMHRLKGNAATLGGEQLAILFDNMEESLNSENYSNFDEKLKLSYTLLAAFNYLSNGWYSE